MGASSMATGRRRGPARRWAVRVAVAGAVLPLLVTGCTPDGQAPPQQKVAGPVVVQLAVYGSSDLVQAYRRVAARFSAGHRAIVVSVRAYADHDAALAATRRRIQDGHGPSLFLMDRSDLEPLLSEQLTMPVDELLGARHVDFGDGYARTALEAFSRDAALQCMPTQLSPLVVYYNTRLVDLAAAQGRDGDPITPEDGWTFAQFARAARQAATRAAPHGNGLWIEPTLEQLAPFISSAGGDVVDDDEDPSSVTLSGASAVEALRQVRRLLRRPGVAPTAAQLARRDAVARFEDGDLAMILGHRDLTAQLRRHADLSFDVMPLPKERTHTTTGDVQGVCLTRTRSQTVADAAADFLAYLVSDPAAAVLARTGAVLPTNLEVEASPAFLQPGKQPASAEVFPAEVRRIELLPAGPRWEAAAAVADRGLADVFTGSRSGHLIERLTAIEESATAVLTPPTAPSTTPSSGASAG